MSNIKKEKLKDFIGMTAQRYNLLSKNSIETCKKDNDSVQELIDSVSSGLLTNTIVRTTEQSVTPLINAKEGLIYIDELEGNTMVNYCTNGNDTLTLNGDIDLEGVKLSTDQGVDNGIVDVMCEGNTLINLNNDMTYSLYTPDLNTGKYTYITREKNEVKVSITEDLASWYYVPAGIINHTMIKPNTEYTACFDKCLGVTGVSLMSGDATITLAPGNTNIKNNKVLLTTKTILPEVTKDINVYCNINGKAGTLMNISNAILLEGNWTDKEVPPYFTGMKSVGEKEDGTGQIDLLSQKGNENELRSTKDFKYDENRKTGWRINSDFSKTIDSEGFTNLCVSKSGNESNMYYSAYGSLIPCKKGDVVTLSVWFKVADINQWDIKYPYIFEVYDAKGNRVQYKDINITNNETNKPIVVNNEWTYISATYTVEHDEAVTMSMRLCLFKNGDISFKKPKIEFGSNSSTWSPNKNDNIVGYHNAKQLIFNEPLRKFDSIIKLSGKWYIKRGTGVKTVTGNQYWTMSGRQFEKNSSFYFGISDSKIGSEFICDKYTYMKEAYTNRVDIECLTNNVEWSDQIFILNINKSKLTSQTVEGLKAYLTNNPFTFYYELDKPTYEPLEINPELTCYNNFTSITNNSIIPCNMKVKNKGYNVEIKPNTEYTVVADTNTNSRITFTLGGTKKPSYPDLACTNITTPAILEDNVLRLSAKGTIAKNIRVLEGNHLENAPSMFNGLLSSFEDKQNMVKLKSIDENLFHNKELREHNTITVERPDLNNVFLRGQSMNDYAFAIFKIDNLESEVLYEITANVNALSGEPLIAFYDINRSNYGIKSKLETGTRGTFILKKGHNSIFVRLFANHLEKNVTGNIEYKNIKLTKTSINTFKPYKENELSLQLNEPLRGIENIRDRFVIKDGKLMIERNCKEVVFSNDTTKFEYSYVTQDKAAFGLVVQKIKALKDAKRCNKFEYNTKYTICDKYTIKNENNWYDRKGYYYENQGNYVFVFDWGTTLDQAIEKLTGAKFVFDLDEPIYEEIPENISKLLLSNYINGTLVAETNIAPKTKLRYHGAAPVSAMLLQQDPAVKLNTTDLNENVIPYLMDMDYRIVQMQLTLESNGEALPATLKSSLVSDVVAMLEKDIKTKSYSKIEYQKRIDTYLKANKISQKEYELLQGVLNNEYEKNN